MIYKKNEHMEEKILSYNDNLTLFFFISINKREKIYSSDSTRLCFLCISQESVCVCVCVPTGSGEFHTLLMTLIILDLFLLIAARSLFNDIIFIAFREPPFLYAIRHMFSSKP